MESTTSNEVDTAMEVKIVSRKYHEFNDTNHPIKINREVFINDIPVEMGEGVGEIYKAYCNIHKRETWHIGGYNQGGFDAMCVCLECADLISHFLRYEYKEDTNE